MGLAQGRRFQPLWRGILLALLGNELTPKWLRMAGPSVLQGLLKVQGLRVRRRNLDNMIRHARFQLERMTGIADGVGVSPNVILGMSSIETMAASFQFILGCTSLALGRKRSKSGKPLLAYNHDFPTFLKHHLFVRRSLPKHGYRSVQLTYPALPGSICGVNEMGVAVSLNHAFSTEPHNDGVPPTMLIQEALDHCKTAEEALRLFRTTKFSCGSIATFVDKKGAIYSLELSQGRFGVRRPVQDLSLTLNEYQLVPLREIEVPQEAFFHPKKFPKVFHGIPVHLSNWERRERFQTLLEGKRKLSISELKDYLSDHNGNGAGDIGTICRHHPTSDTIATAILHPQEGVLEVARGHACKAAYQKFAL